MVLHPKINLGILLAFIKLQYSQLMYFEMISKNLKIYIIIIII